MKKYMVVFEDNLSAVMARGFWDREKAQEKIDSGYWHGYMYACDKHRKLIVVEEK